MDVESAPVGKFNSRDSFGGGPEGLMCALLVCAIRDERGMAEEGRLSPRGSPDDLKTLKLFWDSKGALEVVLKLAHLDVNPDYVRRIVLNKSSVSISCCDSGRTDGTRTKTGSGIPRG